MPVTEGRLTYKFEGEDSPLSPWYSQKTHWPGGNSGVTIGRGYDLGDRNRDEVVVTLRNATIREEQVQAIADGAKKRNECA